MNRLRFVIIIAGILTTGCDEGRLGAEQNAEQKGFVPVKAQEPTPKPDSLSRTSIDLDKSVVKWKGTKMLGTGSHEGTVKFSQGELLLSDGKLAGGRFVVDMASIYITDIPLSDPVPRRNLTSHLNSDFETGLFPEATFDITAVEAHGATYQITGALTIKGVANTITLTATEAPGGTCFTAKFSFDRHLWDIGENGSWLEQKLVDAEVFLEISICTL